MKYRSVLLFVHLAGLVSLSVQRHLLSSKNGSWPKRGANRAGKFSVVPVYLIKSPVERLKMESSNVNQRLTGQESANESANSNTEQDGHQEESGHTVENHENNQVTNVKSQAVIGDIKSSNEFVNFEHSIARPADSYDLPLIESSYSDFGNTDLNRISIGDDQLIAKRLDDLGMARKLGGLAGLTSLLTHSQRRISPLNKLILGLLGPKLIKLQLDMMFGAVISELVRKLVMPVIGFVIDKNLPVSAVQNKMQQVPNYSTNQIEQLQNAYASLTATTPSPAVNSNYVNHPSYQSSSSTADGSIPYTYYGQAQLANYLASQPQSGKSVLSSQETTGQSTTAQQTGSIQTDSPSNPKLTTEQISQQLNQLISQYANAINQQAAIQQSAQQSAQHSGQQAMQPSTPPPASSAQNQVDQNGQLYQQLQGLMQEQVKMKNQLQHLTKPKNYFAKEMQLDEDEKEPYQSDDESSLKEAPLNQIEQEYDRATRWNSVLKNMDHFIYNNETSAI